MKRKTDNFSKFYTKKNNAAIKEAFRQEKKAEKKARKEGIERHFEEKRKAREQQFAARGPVAGTEGKRTATSGNNGPASKGAAPASGKSAPAFKSAGPADPNALPLNKYIAHGGICSRRDAADLIRLGKVQVNGQLVTEPGTKVFPEDEVKINGKKVTISRNFVYILLNKPKDYITTTEDPQGRRTVLDLIRPATTERVFPIGRLDRNTSGVLLLTNDGDLAQKLAHPKHEIKKIYHVSLDKPLVKADFDKIITGIQLEDGLAHVDVLAYADPKDRTQIGLEIHSGRNRIVRRIFEHLGYDVRGLDRVMYAGLTKKNVQRGHWRMLTEKEIRILKYLNSSFRGSLSAPKAQHSVAIDIDEDSDEGWIELTGEENKNTSDTPAARDSGKFKPQSAGSGPDKFKPHSSGTGPKKFKRPYSGRPEPGADAGPKKFRPSTQGSEKAKTPAESPRGRKSSGSYNKSKFTSREDLAPDTRKERSVNHRDAAPAARKGKSANYRDAKPGARKSKFPGQRDTEHGSRKPKPRDHRDAGPRKSASTDRRDSAKDFKGTRKEKPRDRRDVGPRKPASTDGRDSPEGFKGSRKPKSQKPYGRRPH